MTQTKEPKLEVVVQPDAAAVDQAEGSEAPEPSTPEAAPTPIPSASTQVTVAPLPGSADPLDPEYADVLKRLGKSLGMPVWLLVQADHRGPCPHLEEPVRRALTSARSHLTEPVALIIDSPGGNAATAFQVAKLLKRRAGGFTAVVPRYAKSAATLLSLGGSPLLMGSMAELGPLDVQLMDPEREEYGSALDEVQALERLHSAALDQMDQTMFMLAARTHKRLDTLLPPAARFATDLTRPLLDKIDTVHYSKSARLLKVAEEYAIRLLQWHYPRGEAEQIARHLVNSYPEHGFVIDRDEASSFLNLGDLTDEQEGILDELADLLDTKPTTIIGRMEEGPV